MTIFQQIWSGYTQNFMWMFLLFLGLWGLSFLLYVIAPRIRNVLATFYLLFSSTLVACLAKFYSSVFGLITVMAFISFIFK